MTAHRLHSELALINKAPAGRIGRNRKSR
jgi:hypothetical protein